MFGFGKKYKDQADKIGDALHEQISGANKENHALASQKLQSPFFVGYLFYFISMGFIAQGVPSKQTDKYVKYICNGIIPGELWEIFQKQMKFVKASQAAKRENETKEFEIGGEAGMWDGSNLISWDRRASKTNLKAYLLSQELEYLEPNS